MRAKHLKDNPTCAGCGATKHLEVHHIRPFHLFPDEELDPHNLMTLCETPGWECHRIIGHKGNWRDYRLDPACIAAEIAEALKGP